MERAAGVGRSLFSLDKRSYPLLFSGIFFRRENDCFTQTCFVGAEPSEVDEHGELAASGRRGRVPAISGNLPHSFTGWAPGPRQLSRKEPLQSSSSVL